MLELNGQRSFFQTQKAQSLPLVILKGKGPITPITFLRFVYLNLAKYKEDEVHLSKFLSEGEQQLRTKGKETFSGLTDKAERNRNQFLKIINLSWNKVMDVCIDEDLKFSGKMDKVMALAVLKQAAMELIKEYDQTLQVQA